MTRIFRILPIFTIAFASGISGAWWAAQFTAPLPPAWGWFGAALIGVSLWSGVEIAVTGQKTGWAIALIAGLGDVIMARAYFAAHTPLMAWTLALVPTGLTLLTSYQASLHQARQTALQAARQAQAHQEQLKAQEANRRHRQRLEKLKLQARLAADTHHATPDTAATPVAPVADIPTASDTAATHPATRPDFAAWVAQHPHGITVKQAAQTFGVATRTIQRRLRRLGYAPGPNNIWMPQT